MKKYFRLELEVTQACDVITTSQDVTTDGVKFPWETTGRVSTSSFELLEVRDLYTSPSGNYEI